MERYQTLKRNQEVKPEVRLYFFFSIGKVQSQKSIKFTFHVHQWHHMKL